MLHPRLSGGSAEPVWLAEIGDFGAWGDLKRTTRWGTGASGNFEVSLTMPLPVDFEHPLLRRGARLEVMDGDLRVGSSLAIAQITRGSLDKPWEIVAEGVGRLAEGRSSFYALDGSGAVTTTPEIAVDAAIARGLKWAGPDATIPGLPIGAAGEPVPLGDLLNSAVITTGSPGATHWGVWDEDLVGFRDDPTEPAYQVVLQNLTLSVADDSFATVVYVRYTDVGTGLNATVHSPAAAPPAETEFDRQEYLVPLTDRPAMSAAAAQDYADGIYEAVMGRLAFTDRLTLTADELQTIGGERSDLTMVEAGQMVRLQGITSQLLEYDGLTYFDIVIGQGIHTDGAQTIDIAPTGLAARDLAAIVEDITGWATAA